MKVAFLDIDGTLTSEVDGSIPESAREAIHRARTVGHKMFINTGRCFQNVEPRFREVGWDGYVCGCGTDIYAEGQNILYQPMTREITKQILEIARKTDVDIVFESRKEVSFDPDHTLHHPDAIAQYEKFLARGYHMRDTLDTPNFFADKFCIWYENEEQLWKFRLVSDPLFEFIDRGNHFAEFVPYGYSKATGIYRVLDYYGLSIADAYAFGDSRNDISMLVAVPQSVAMGNAEPEELKDMVSYVTTKASEDGIAKAFEALGFFKEDSPKDYRDFTKV